MAQVKLVVDDDLARRFKQTVLAKRGKMETSREGEEALKLYLEKNKDFTPTKRSKKTKKRGDQGIDPILHFIGAVKSKGKPNALEDVKTLDSSEI